MFDQVVVGLGDGCEAAEVVPFASALARRCQASMRVVPIEDLPVHRVPVTTVVSGSAPGWIGDRPVSSQDPRHPGDSRSALVVLSEPPARTAGGAPEFSEPFRAPPLPGSALLLRAGVLHQVLGSARRSPKFLVAMIDRERDDPILPAVADLALAVNAHLTLVTVVSPTEPERTGSPLQGVSIRLAQLFLDRVADLLRDRGLSVNAVVLSGIDPARSVLDQLDHGYDLLAIGCPVPSPDGSSRVIDAAMAESTKPLLIVRPESGE